MAAFLKPPDLIVYLRCAPETALARIRPDVERRRRELRTGRGQCRRGRAGRDAV